MTMAERVPMLDREQAQLRAAECGLPEELADLSVFRVALHQPRVAVALHGLLDALLFRGSLDARLRELVIMRIGWITGSEYEWTQHWRIATLLGVIPKASGQSNVRSSQRPMMWYATGSSPRKTGLRARRHSIAITRF
ncbi:Carboxymuconolactone decarboxylase family [Mycobacteroides abscessus subsp. abscessus]|nr:Carboxymuconolactone decarboxylase family [Mycobacteroides abscessus subsp. abscessus]